MNGVIGPGNIALVAALLFLRFTNAGKSFSRAFMMETLLRPKLNLLFGVTLATNAYSWPLLIKLHRFSSSSAAIWFSIGRFISGV